MSVKTRAELKAENSADLPNNQTRLISPADLRGQMDDIVDSMFMFEDMGPGGPPVAFLHPDPPSALARPWVQRGRELCSPFDIITNQDDQDEILSGAGTFDATTQLQEAFAWAKRVEFPGGIQTKPCLLVSHVLPLQNDQTLIGNGCRIIIPDIGWPLGVTDNFGLFQTKGKSRWRIEGFHVNYPASVTANISNTPKAVYFENSTDGWVVGNIFEGTKFETCWGGGSSANTRRLHFLGNTFIDCAHGVNAGDNLPALQMNCVDSEAIGNHFIRPGIGIGNSGARNVVVGNSIEDPWLEGIGLGDGFSQEGNVMSSNRVRVYSHASLVRRGILINDGPETPLSGVLASCESNYVHLVGTHGHVTPIGIWVNGTRVSSIGKNIITGEGEFTGLSITGRNTSPLTHTRVDIDGLTIRALTETGTCYGVSCVASGGVSPGDVTITARLRNVVVDGIGNLIHLNYDNQTADFTAGATLTGPTGSGTIASITDSGTTGTIFVSSATGTFTNDQIITDSSGGSAQVNGVTATSSYAYDIRSAGTAVMNGTMDNCWKTGGLFRFGAVQYDTTTYSNIPIQYGLGLLQNTATYDPPSLAAGVVDTAQTITVTGAALGDSVEATFSLDLQGIVLRAWVSAANTVKYQFSCPTGGATVDLGSGTVKCRVKK